MDVVDLYILVRMHQFLCAKKLHKLRMQFAWQFTVWYRHLVAFYSHSIEQLLLLPDDSTLQL